MAVLVTAAAALVVGVASAAPPEGYKIACFDGTTDGGGFHGTCELLSPNRALLNTIDNDTDPNNSYAGVYVPNSAEVLAGTLLADVSKLSFHFRASDGTTASGGSPRMSIPIDENADRAWDGFAFVDVLGCNDGSTIEGRVDVINDPTCTIWYGATSYTNWSAFAAANATFTIADTWAFVIVDQPGEWTVWNVQLGTTSRGGT